MQQQVMNILFTAVGDFLTLEGRSHLETWKAWSHIVEPMPMEVVASYLHFDSASALALVDAIVCMADADSVAFYGYKSHPAFRFSRGESRRTGRRCPRIPGGLHHARRP